MLKGKPDHSGHLNVHLSYQGKKYFVSIHRLVMCAFVGPPPVGKEVRHLNGIPTDNRLENLKYGTRKENILDVFRQGKPWKKLTMDQARNIKRALAAGKSLRRLSKEFGVSPRSIQSIKEGRTFQWLS